MQNNSDKFDHLIALAATRCIDEEVKEFKETDVSGVNFDDAYYRKRKQIINKYKRRPAMRLTKIISVRVAAAILIILTLTCVLIGCVPKWREAIFRAIVEWYDDCFAVSYEDPNGQAKETGYEGEPAADTGDDIIDVPTYIEEVRKPRDMPDGVWEDIILQTTSRINIDYYINEEYIFSFTQRILAQNEIYIDNEEVNITQIKINGNDATVVDHINKKEIYILWNDGEYSYHIFATEYDLETLIGYAESVK